MTNENHPKVRDLLDNYDNYMEQLIAMPDKVLERKVRLAIMQSQMALEQEKFVEVDVLCLFRDMIIQARIKRQEMGLEDEEEPKLEIDKPTKKKKNKKIDQQEELSVEINLLEPDIESKEENLKPEQLLLF
ncbi:MAG: hypothetical protein SGI96_07710 [Bacteroidota bacterium]|nr:hypothetical protein [Bacteroidota bacterium]